MNSATSWSFTEVLRTDSQGEIYPPTHGPQRPGEQTRSSVNPSNAARLLGWHPEVELDKGLKETLCFFGAI
jgi:UDP-glucose 4-epimerase